jgi:hypothetical protein
MAAACTLVTAVVLLAFPFPAAAHAPTALALSYDAAAQALTVEITHASQSPATHFIKKVEISRDGKVLSTTEYKSQPGQATFSYTYPLDNPGGTLEVRVSCSIFGSRTETMRTGKTLR